MSESETWTETSPNLMDSDGDSFDDDDEKDWGYDPLLIDTDGDGLNDNVEDSSNHGIKDSTETSVTNSDTDGDGLSDKMEIDGWTVVVILETTFEIKEERVVSSDPLSSDFDGDGVLDSDEFENGTDPNDVDTDGDGKTDYEEMKGDFYSSPTGFDGNPPEIWFFDYSYEENIGNYNPIKLLTQGLKFEIDVGINDFFGVESIWIDIKGLADRNSIAYGEENITTTFYWAIFSIDEYQSVLFKGFHMNISIFDVNSNTGYRNVKVQSISKLLTNNIVGRSTSLVNIIDVFKLEITNLIKDYLLKK